MGDDPTTSTFRHAVLAATMAFLAPAGLMPTPIRTTGQALATRVLRHLDARRRRSDPEMELVDPR